MLLNDDVLRRIFETATYNENGEKTVQGFVTLMGKELYSKKNNRQSFLFSASKYLFAFSTNCRLYELY